MKKLKYLVGLFFFLLVSASPNTESPNILFILADDWSYPYAGFYGHKDVKTPNLDALAQSGVVFHNAFSGNPSCSPSRASMLTGKYSHKLKEAVNLVGKLDTSETTYVKLLKAHHYAVAYDRKGWAPANITVMGYKENPAGPKIEFNTFIDKLIPGIPFCFWWGTDDPHRPFTTGSGAIDSSKIEVPGFLPDKPAIRSDLADYIASIQRMDTEVGKLLEKLKEKNLLENTIIVVTSDNGMPFPHAKANLYDFGTRVPLLISYPKRFLKNKRSDDFVNLLDLFPSFLDFAMITKPKDIDGQSLLPILMGQNTRERKEVFLERERHCMARSAVDNRYPGYPMRAIRTKDYLYIMNLRPERNPAGDASIAGTPSEYGDVDGGKTKAYMIDHQNDKDIEMFFNLGFGKRPVEELYDVKKDPYNLVNLAAKPEYKSTKILLKSKLTKWMRASNDPRYQGKGDEIDGYENSTKAWITKWSIVFW